MRARKDPKLASPFHGATPVLSRLLGGRPGCRGDLRQAPAEAGRQEAAHRPLSWGRAGPDPRIEPAERSKLKCVNSNMVETKLQLQLLFN